MRIQSWALAALTLLGATVAPEQAHARPPSPFVKGPYLQSLQPTEVVIRTEVDPPAPILVEAIAIDARVGTPTLSVRDESRALHSVHLEGLSPATRYTYVVTQPSGAKVGGAFTTAPATDAHGPFTFLIYGDDRTDDTSHAAVVRALSQTPSDFLLHTGDFVEDGSVAAQWQTFFDIEGTLLRDRCVFACVGNHELLEAQGLAFLRYFGPVVADGASPPDLYSSVRWENTRFFLLNAMDAWTTSAQKDWLESELRKADWEPGLVWRFVVVHYGPWSAGPHGLNRRLHEVELPALLRAHKVDLIISGHDHIYERGDEHGLRYLVSGGAGAPLYRNITPLPSTRKVEAAYHFIEATVSDEAVKLVAKRVDGSILDRCGFAKAQRPIGTWDCDAHDPPVPSAAASAAEAARPPDPPSTSSKCGCRLVGEAGRARDGLALVVALVALRRRRPGTRASSPRARPS